MNDHDHCDGWHHGYREGETPITVVIEGGARGADCMARMWATRNELRNDTHPANWDAYGPKAGPIRNQQMLDNAKPDLVVAFSGGRGTADMVRRARASGVRVVMVDRAP